MSPAILFMIQLAITPQPDSMDVNAFIPKGHEIQHLAKGDLNNDGLEDFILVTADKMQGMTDSFDMTRPVMILLQEKNGDLKLAARNNQAVLCFHCGGAFGDPFSGILIKNGGFTIYHYGGSSWRWAIDAEFTWSTTDRQWYLQKTIHSSHHIYEPGITAADTVVSTEKIPFEKYVLDE